MATTRTYDDPVLDDFRNFLYLLWEFLRLPEPTPAQYEIAYAMQHGIHPEMYDPVTGRSDIIMAFRGVGKSYIAAGYCLWRLKRNPRDEKILVISATLVKAKEFVAQVKAILMGWEYLTELRPRPDQRDGFDRFDVNGASIAQAPSLKAASITGQITGSRATCIIGDDIEIPENSKTEEGRVNVLNKTLEFDNIKLPALKNDDQSLVLDANGSPQQPAGDIINLGTPQTEESIYLRMIKTMGFNCFCWPGRYPTADKRANYILKRDNGESVDILALPLAQKLDANPALHWQPTDPRRFTAADLIGREAKGRSNFMLQFMLDTTLSDAERYPLKQNDLIVFSVNRDKAPLTMAWGRHSDRLNIRDDIPNVGFMGDYFMGPLFVDKEWREYNASVCFVDPSGRGKDELAWAILKAINGTLYLCHVGAHRGDINEGMVKVATDAKAYNVNQIEIEPNFAPGIWISAFQPILSRVWPPVKKGDVGGCTVIESEWAKGQKEARIIDTLEPVMNSHRLVVDESCARDEVLMYQLTHITRDRGALVHDDRLDAVAGAVASMWRMMAIDVGSAKTEVIQAELDAMLEDFIETCEGYPGQFRRGRGRKRKNGEHTEVYASQH